MAGVRPRPCARTHGSCKLTSPRALAGGCDDLVRGREGARGRPLTLWAGAGIDGWRGAAGRGRMSAVEGPPGPGAGATPYGEVAEWPKATAC